MKCIIADIEDKSLALHEKFMEQHTKRIEQQKKFETILCFRCNSNDKTIIICNECRGFDPIHYFRCKFSSHRSLPGDNSYLKYGVRICKTCLVELHTSHLCNNECGHEDKACEKLRATQISEIDQIYK